MLSTLGMLSVGSAILLYHELKINEKTQEPKALDILLKKLLVPNGGLAPASTALPYGSEDPLDVFRFL